MSTGGGQRTEFERWDHYITEEGEYGNEMMVIVGGVVGVESKGRKLGELKAGDFFGENAVLHVHSAKGVLRTRSVYCIERATVAHLLSDDLVAIQRGPRCHCASSPTHAHTRHIMSHNYPDTHTH